MSRLPQAIEIYNEEGILSLIKKSAGFVKRVGYLSLVRANNKYYQIMKDVGEGKLIMEEDWDNIIILDACRADLFEETFDTESFDSYQRIASAGSKTKNWTGKNFGGKEFGDTVYVNANTMVTNSNIGKFHKFIDVWDDDSAYDEELRTIPADVVIEYARRAAEEYPDKRLIIHFIQPHFPFVTQPDLIFRPQWGGEGSSEDNPNHVWDALERGLISKEEAWSGYSENLEFIASDIDSLAEELPGKTVISSDHGNMVGERTPFLGRIYGHPGKIRTPELVCVPWAVYDNSPRKEIIDDGVESTDSLDSDKMKQRLEALGYVD